MSDERSKIHRWRNGRWEDLTDDDWQELAIERDMDEYLIQSPPIFSQTPEPIPKPGGSKK